MKLVGKLGDTAPCAAAEKYCALQSSIQFLIFRLLNRYYDGGRLCGE